MQRGIAKNSYRWSVTPWWVERDIDSHDDILLAQLSELFRAHAGCSSRLATGSSMQPTHPLRDGVCVVLNILLKERAALEAIRVYEAALMNSMAMFEPGMAVTANSDEDGSHSGSDNTDEFDRILTVIKQLGHQHGAWARQSQAVGVNKRGRPVNLYAREL